ncbi:hypothetical protein [Streptomyces anulatus]|uniref:hypothetical protein n=1 Tax=Streptomyces anulatus TaxID=1892 RepID=UPI001D1814B6|nr:hypothetical protein [Streptomyces anulatus]
MDASPGVVDLLLAIGAEQLDLLLTGRTLRDQGVMLTGLLEAGWPVPLLRELVMRPLPDPLRRTVGAVISGRLKAAAGARLCGGRHRPAPGSDPGAPGPGGAAVRGGADARTGPVAGHAGGAGAAAARYRPPPGLRGR